MQYSFKGRRSLSAIWLITPVESLLLAPIQIRPAQELGVDGDYYCADGHKDCPNRRI